MMTLNRFEGKPCEVVDMLISPTTKRRIAIIRQGLNTFPVDAADLEIKDTTASTGTTTRNAAYAAPRLVVEFNGDRADIEFDYAPGESHYSAYGFVREETADAHLQAVSYAIQIIRDKLTRYGEYDD